MSRNSPVSSLYSLSCRVLLPPASQYPFLHPVCCISLFIPPPKLPEPQRTSELARLRLNSRSSLCSSNSTPCVLFCLKASWSTSLLLVCISLICVVWVCGVAQALSAAAPFTTPNFPCLTLLSMAVL
uniref:Uncharacterized protein n=1 Tax=Coccidioides posadasii RMSCC 3488 TaxID=454284 RepID=A0A0J6FBF2_COCPO|nr:hypothetical protein CPAG_06668 [Coccidioides posadasii RMSCC 3488]